LLPFPIRVHEHQRAVVWGKKVFLQGYASLRIFAEKMRVRGDREPETREC
jgi:hypothetical protein